MESSKVFHRRKLDFPVTALKAPQKSQEVSTKSLELSKVIRLLEDPLTANLKDRHLFVLKKLLKRSQIGFLLKELTSIAKILDLCAEKVPQHPEYSFFLCEALKLCRLPFLKEKTSDEQHCAQNVVEFLCHMGYLMRVSDADIRQHVIESVKSFYSFVTPKQQIHGTERPSKPQLWTFSSHNRFSRLSLKLQQTSPGYRLQLLEYSDLPQTLLLSMATMENQPALKLLLLHTLQLISRTSDMSCASMLYARGAETICLHMSDPDPSGQILSLSTEILWNLLERGNKEEVTAQLSSVECVVSLKEAFLKQLQSGSGNADLQLRNELLVITTLIAENPNSPLVESLFARYLVFLATFPEMKSRNILIDNLKLTFNKEDLKMKKMLLNLLVLMSRDFAALELYKEERLVQTLLNFIKPFDAPPEGRLDLRHWSSAQCEDLQLQALATLNTIAPLMLEDYMSCQGNACVLLLLGWCVGPDSYFGEGHCFHGTGGRGTKKAQMRHCIRLLRSVTLLGEEFVNQDLCDQGVIGHLLGILSQMDAHPDQDDLIFLEMKTDVQLILSALCDPEMHRKELFGSEGVELMVHFLKKGSDKFHSGLGHNKLILSTIYCVWSCIVGCYTTEDYFLAKEGASILLDLLSVGPNYVYGIILTTLLDLCDNPSTVSHLLNWRGRDGQMAPGLLVQLWREEEERLAIQRNRHGGITDPKRPVLSCSHHHDDGVQQSFPQNVPSVAVLEVSENLRAKIYFIFSKLGFEDLPGLVPKDYVTVSIIRRYLDFKVSEVWNEINQELSLEGVRPISPDQEALTSIGQITEDTVRRTAAEQNNFLDQQRRVDLGEDEVLYTQIKSHLKQCDVKAKSWNNFVARTSNYEILKELKEERERFTELSKRKPEEADTAVNPTEDVVHRVDDEKAEGAEATGHDKEEPTAQDPEYFSTVSEKR